MQSGASLFLGMMLAMFHLVQYLPLSLPQGDGAGTEMHHEKKCSMRLHGPQSHQLPTKMLRTSHMVPD